MATILLVDDDQDILNFGKKILAAAGFDVLVAHNALEACDIMNTHPFDLVISDANMPKHSGFDFIKTLRSDERFKKLPVALLTARRDRKDIQHAIEIGVDDYIVKPIDPILFVKKIESMFVKKPAHERASFDLQEIEIRFSGFAKIEAQILTVSEIGLVIETPQALFEGQTIHLDTPLFDHMRIKAPVLKILSCENQKNLKTWRSRLLFIGADDSTLQKIRAWINIQTANRRIKAG